MIYLPTELLRFYSNRPVHQDADFVRHPGQFLKISRSVTLGNGDKLFKIMSSMLLDGTITNALPWASLATPRRNAPLVVNDTIATITRFYSLPLWSFNPCRVTRVGTFAGGKSSKSESVLEYATIKGHFLCGKESLRMTLAKDNLVVYEMSTTARGSHFLSRISMPLIRPLQRKFLDDHIKAIQMLAQSSK